MDNQVKRADMNLWQPLLLLAGLMTYLLGVSIACHIGRMIDPTNFVLGFLLCLFLILMRNLIAAYYDHPDSPICSLSTENPKYEMLKKWKRQHLLQFSLVILTAGAMVTVFVILRKALNPAGLILLGIAFLLCFFYGTPPLRLFNARYGEFSESILIANLFPAIGFLLQESELHILLLMLTLPLTLVYLAMKIAFSLERYAFESTHIEKSIAANLGWQKAMPLHNLLILCAFLLIGIFALFGMAWSLTWPLLLSLPVGIFQIIQMLQIMQGAKPHWRLLKWTAAGLFAVMTYLEVMSLWVA